jgi:hypothetical protein
MNVTDYLRQTSAMGAALDAFILEVGQSWEMSPIAYLTDMRERGQCYMNAAHLAMENSWDYVEGYAVTDLGIPLMHAWCIDENREVIDPTWEDGLEYFGVVIPAPTHMRVALETEVYGVLPNLWMYRGDRNEVLREIRKLAREEAA